MLTIKSILLSFRQLASPNNVFKMLLMAYAFISKLASSGKVIIFFHFSTQKAKARYAYELYAYVNMY